MHFSPADSASSGIKEFTPEAKRKGRGTYVQMSQRDVMCTVENTHLLLKNFLERGDFFTFDNYPQTKLRESKAAPQVSLPWRGDSGRSVAESHLNRRTEKRKREKDADRKGK